MKEIGAQTKTGGGMAKGEAPYDQAKAQAIFATYVDAATKAPALFPENSKTGGDTAALPAIWHNMADFEGKFDKFGAEAKAAQSSVKDLDSSSRRSAGSPRTAAAATRPIGRRRANARFHERARDGRRRSFGRLSFGHAIR